MTVRDLRRLLHGYAPDAVVKILTLDGDVEADPSHVTVTVMPADEPDLVVLHVITDCSLSH